MAECTLITTIKPSTGALQNAIEKQESGIYLNTPRRDILRLPEIFKMTGRSRSAHYADIKSGVFVKPILIGKRATVTAEHEVNTINTARIAGMSDDKIRALVVKLETIRKADFKQGVCHE